MRNNLEEHFQNLREQASNDTTAISQATNQGTLSFIAITEMVDLPSKGRFYPDEHPLAGKETIEIKQMTAKEEDILTNKSFLKKGILLDKLLEAIVIDKTIPVSSLLIGDKNAILVASRISAYGSKYDVGVTCLDCGNKNELSVDLAEAELKDISKIEQQTEIQYSRTSTGGVAFKLPKTKWDVVCKLLNGSDEKRLLALLEAKKRNSTDAEISLSEQLNIIIESINGVDDPRVISDAISIMPAFDAKYIRTTYAKLIPNILIKKKFSCGSCNGEQEVEVPFTQEFFWPK